MMDSSFYFLLLIVCAVFSMWASFRVNSTFKKYSSLPSARNITGFTAARRILDANGLQNVQILPTAGNLSDHFDPRTNTVYLSESVYNSANCAAIGVASHEVGHAIQHARGYFPVKLRSAIVPATNLVSRVAPFLILIGLMLSYYAPDLILLAYAGIIGFAAAAFFQLVTLQAEFDASRRAMEAVTQYDLVSAQEASGAKKVLSAAALTYVAALASSVVQVLRMISIVMASDSRRRR